jgi:hypothetical protein
VKKKNIYHSAGNAGIGKYPCKKTNLSTSITDNILFVMRTGYLKNYPEPALLRRLVEWFVHS